MAGAAIPVVAALAIGLSVLCWRVSASYRPLLYDKRDVPIQWMIGGEVTRTASPRFALAFVPALTAGLMAVMVVLAASAPADERWAIVPVELVVGVMMIALNAFMLSRAAR